MAQMTRVSLFHNVLSDMKAAGYDVGSLSTTEDVYNEAKKAGLTEQTTLDSFNALQGISREEAALVFSRGLGQDPEYGTGVDYAMGVDLYQGFEGGVRGTGDEPFYNYYYNTVGSKFRNLLPSGGGGYDGWMAGADNVLNEFADMNAITDAENALEIIKDKLREYGLEGLADEAYEMLLDGVSPDVVVLRLRETEEFAARFPGMEMRSNNNMSAISPAEYISLERQYRQVMMTAGIPEGFYDSVDDFAEFIGNDVSPAEMNERVALAVTAVDAIDPNLKTQLRDLYGIGVENDGELISYYLDPQRGTDIIEQRLQLEAAGLSAASVSTLGSGFNQQTSERLVDMNVQKREIAERFRGQRAVTQQLVGEDEFTSSEFAAAEFGLDSDAVADLAQLRGQRSQRGVRQSGALVTRTGAVGLGSAT